MQRAQWQSIQRSHKGSNAILSGRGTGKGCFASIAVYKPYGIESNGMVKLNPVSTSEQLPQPTLGFRTSGDAMPTKNGRSQVPVGSGRGERA